MQVHLSSVFNCIDHYIFGSLTDDCHFGVHEVFVRATQLHIATKEAHESSKNGGLLNLAELEESMSLKDFEINLVNNRRIFTCSRVNRISLFCRL